jgi:hypothetical protein
MSALIVDIFLILDIEFPLYILIAPIANIDTLLLSMLAMISSSRHLSVTVSFLNNDKKSKPANPKNDPHVNWLCHQFALVRYNRGICRQCLKHWSL